MIPFTPKTYLPLDVSKFLYHLIASDSPRASVPALLEETQQSTVEANVG